MSLYRKMLRARGVKKRTKKGTPRGHCDHATPDIYLHATKGWRALKRGSTKRRMFCEQLRERIALLNGTGTFAAKAEAVYNALIFAGFDPVVLPGTKEEYGV